MRFEVLTVVADENISPLGCYIMLAGFLRQLDMDNRGMVTSLST
jgi:hypothetical protein